MCRRKKERKKENLIKREPSLVWQPKFCLYASLGNGASKQASKHWLGLPVDQRHTPSAAEYSKYAVLCCNAQITQKCYGDDDGCIS